MGKTYTKEYLQQILKNAGLKVIGEIKTSNDKVLCETEEGYYVLAIPFGIIRRNDKPIVFSKHNPHTIYNIKIWLKNNNVDSLELLSDEFLGSKQNLKWMCKNCGEIFDATLATIFNGKKYCNHCSHSKRYDDLKDYFYIISNECKNRNYKLLTKVISRSNSEFEYICNKHDDMGIQHSNYDRFINSKQGCKYCGIESRGIIHRLEEYKIKQLVESKGFIFHSVNYDNDNNKKKTVNIQVICPNHKDKGIQNMKYNNLMNNTGKCIYCIGRERTQSDLQKELDSKKLCLTILKYTKYSEPIFVKCDICGFTWYSKGVNLTQGHRCPNCSKSKFELDVESVLKENNITYESQYKFPDCRDINPLPFDFYLPDYNTLIEADGEGHYIPIRRTSSMTIDDAIAQLKVIQNHDLIKTTYCNSNHIPLMRIPYWERNNLNNFILTKLN